MAFDIKCFVALGWALLWGGRLGLVFLAFDGVRRWASKVMRFTRSSSMFCKNRCCYPVVPTAPECAPHSRHARFFSARSLGSRKHSIQMPRWIRAKCLGFRVCNIGVPEFRCISNMCQVLAPKARRADTESGTCGHGTQHRQMPKTGHRDTAGHMILLWTPNVRDMRTPNA